jgi:HK97 gp10 family phage protein
MVIAAKGLDRLDRKVKDLSGVDLLPVVQRTTMNVHRTAQALAPKDTGTLAGSIRWQVYKGGSPYGRVSTNVEYGLYQEFGTSKMRAQPFMRPALTLEVNEMRERVKELVRSKVKKLKK